MIVFDFLVLVKSTWLKKLSHSFTSKITGKTHTLMASADGLTTSVVSHVFALIGKDAAHSYAVSINCVCF